MKDCGPITDVEFRASSHDRVPPGPRDWTTSCTSPGGSSTPARRPSPAAGAGRGTCRLYREPVKVLDLMNTIMDNFYAHHYPWCWPTSSAYLEELAWWLDLKRVPKAEYRDYMYVE